MREEEEKEVQEEDEGAKIAAVTRPTVGPLGSIESRVRGADKNHCLAKHTHTLTHKQQRHADTLSNTDVQKGLYADEQILYMVCNLPAQMLSSKPP